MTQTFFEKIQLCCLREKLKNIANYWQCLENRPLEGFVIGLIVFDQIWSTLLLLPTTVVEFLYSDPTGRSSFVDNKWAKFVDIYLYRRYHNWEVDKEKNVLIDTIDWTEERRHINETRVVLDVECSIYENGAMIPGDPGDYLKEVAGHPISSGYNRRLKLAVRLWTAAIFLVYFTTPLILLGMWWRKQRGRIVATYIIFQVIPMVLLVACCAILSEHLMCAVNVIYGRHPISIYLIAFTTVLWIYQLIKFLLLELYVIEMYLVRKRKDYGFRRGVKKNNKNKVAPMGAKGQQMDVEKVVEKEKKLFNRITAEKDDRGPMTGKRLARQILELGETTEDESTAERLKQNRAERLKRSLNLAAKMEVEKKSSKLSMTSQSSTGAPVGKKASKVMPVSVPSQESQLEAQPTSNAKEEGGGEEVKKEGEEVNKEEDGKKDEREVQSANDK